jgi:hypothetical protein
MDPGLPRPPQGRHHGHRRPHRQGHAEYRRRGSEERLGTSIIDVPGVGGGVGGPPGRARITCHAPPRRRSTDRQRAVRQRSSGGLLDVAGARFEQGEIDIDPDDDKLAAQLCSIKWGLDSRGRIRIESKDDMCKRGPSSPDRADAMAIAFAGRANAAPMNVECHAGESIAGDSADEGVVGQPSPKRGTAI